MKQLIEILQKHYTNSIVLLCQNQNIETPSFDEIVKVWRAESKKALQTICDETKEANSAFLGSDKHIAAPTMVGAVLSTSAQYEGLRMAKLVINSQKQNSIS